jgi:hypothetical protein
MPGRYFILYFFKPSRLTNPVSPPYAGLTASSIKNIIFVFQIFEGNERDTNGRSEGAI